MRFSTAISRMKKIREREGIGVTAECLVCLEWSDRYLLCNDMSATQGSCLGCPLDILNRMVLHQGCVLFAREAKANWKNHPEWEGYLEEIILACKLAGD